MANKLRRGGLQQILVQIANSWSNYGGFICRTIHTAFLSFSIRMTPIVTIHCPPMGLASGHWQLNASHYTWFMSLTILSITKSYHGNTFRNTGPLWRESTPRMDSPHKECVMRCFDVYFVIVAKLLYKQSICRLFWDVMTLMWYYCNDHVNAKFQKYLGFVVRRIYRR